METYGSYEEFTSNINKEFLMIRFMPNSKSQKSRWKTNGISADFLAGYIGSFLPELELSRRSEIESGVAFIANELLENAMKYSHQSQTEGESIDLKMELKENYVIFSVTNYVEYESSTALKKFIHKLMTEDPNELYMEQLTNNSDDDSSSGLGYLTTINDWNAKIGWKFEPTQEKVEIEKLTVKAQYPIDHPTVK